MSKRIQDYSVSHLVGGLSFSVLRHANVDRCNSGRFNHQLDDWSEAQWACAVAGETGELCNMIKKRFRGLKSDNITDRMIADEMADIIIYLDLMAAKMRISLGRAIARKFNEVSRKRGSEIRISHNSPDA